MELFSEVCISVILFICVYETIKKACDKLEDSANKLSYKD